MHHCHCSCFGAFENCHQNCVLILSWRWLSTSVVWKCSSVYYDDDDDGLCDNGTHVCSRALCLLPLLSRPLRVVSQTDRFSNYFPLLRRQAERCRTSHSHRNKEVSGPWLITTVLMRSHPVHLPGDHAGLLSSWSNRPVLDLASVSTSDSIGCLRPRDERKSRLRDFRSSRRFR